MTTPCIEEMVEEFFEDQNNIWKSETGMSIAEAKIAEKKLLSDILTLTHQAGIEEAVEEFSKKWHELGIPNGCLPHMQTFVANQLQKAREERKGWKGYVAVDPKADNYKYSPVFSDRKGAELWVKGKEINGLEVVEVDILLVDHSELDQDEPISTTSAQKDEEVSR